MKLCFEKGDVLYVSTFDGRKFDIYYENGFVNVEEVE